MEVNGKMEGNEGELKKRIRESWDKELELNEQDYDVSLALISLVLDEAKNDLLTDVIELCDWENPEGHRDILTIDSKRFKKWFGSLEKKQNGNKTKQ